MVSVTESPIVPGDAVKALEREGAGSLLYHFAVVRKVSDVNTGASYEQTGDTAAELEGIASDLKSRWPLSDVLLVRRTGTLAIGDIISLVAVSAPRSKDAFDACQEGLSRLKKMQTIKKTELYAG